MSHVVRLIKERGGLVKSRNVDECLDYVVRKVKKSGDGILNKINELDRKRVHRRKRENMKRQKFRWLERHQDLRQKVSKLESDISSCKEVLSFVTGNDDCDQDLLRAKENIEGQVIGLRSLLRHVKNDPSRLTQPFYDLLSEVLVSHRDLQDELDCSESILSVEITEARKRIRKALRTNAAENSTRALYSSERVEQLIDSIRVNPDRDHVLVEQVLVNFETLLTSYNSKIKNIRRNIANIAKDKESVERNWSPKDKVVFKKLFEEFNVRTARGRSRREWLDRATMELSGVSRTELCRAADIYCEMLNFQTRLRDSLSARDRACQEEIRRSRKTFEKAEENLKRKDQIQAALRKAAIGQEKRHRILSKLKEIRVAEFERRRIEIEAFNIERLNEASRIASMEKMRRMQDKEMIKEYRTKLEQQHQQIEMERKKRKVKEEKKWLVLNTKNKERVSYRMCLQKKKDRDKQMIIERRLNEEKERNDRLDAVKSTVPYYGRIQNIQIDRSRVQSDTKRFEAYKNASEEERRFGSIDGYYDETIWKDVRFKVQNAIRAAGLHQSAVVKRIFRVDVSAPYA